jgi:hypothetical protein
MLTEKDYCDYETSTALHELGYDCQVIHLIAEKITLYEAQKWLMTQGIHIAPRIYLYHDINLDEQVSWECNIYLEWSAIYTIGKSLTYDDALLLGIKEAIKKLNEDK